jgi:hypothetical protein
VTPADWWQFVAFFAFQQVAHTGEKGPTNSCATPAGEVANPAIATEDKSVNVSAND